MIKRLLVRHCLTLVAVVLFSAPAVVAGQVGPTPATAEPMLRPGDLMRVTVWRNAELSGEFVVLPDGSLGHPLYAGVRVAGIEMGSVRDSISTVLRKYESSPAFLAEPLYRIVVGGDVRNPSIYPLPPTTTLAEAVALAGGVTDRGKLESVRLQRGGQRSTIDLTDPSPDAVANSPVRSGDQLFVERRVSVFREYIAPAGSITAALAAIASLILRN